MLSQDLKPIMMNFKKDVERNHIEGREKATQALRAKGERLLKMDAKNWHTHYYIAFIYDHLANFYMKSDDDKADDYLDIALEHLDQSIELHPSEESYAMKSSIYGKKIGLAPLKGMFLGPKSGSAMSSAYELNGKNPRVWIIDAIGKMHAPSLFGGDKEKSRELLEKAAKAFDNYEEKDSLMIHWGKADAYAWLAMLDIKEGKKELAEEHAKKALSIEANYGFVKFAILAQIKAMKKKDD